MRKLKLFLDAKAANTPPRGISKASRVIFSVLTLLLLSVGNVWGAETVYKTATFAAAKCTSNSTYTGSVTCTVGTDSWTAAYAANNNGKWDYIKMGGKRPSTGGSTVHTGTIVTSASYSEAITKVVVNGSLDRGSVSAKLIYASNAAFTSDKVESSALTAFTDGKMTFTIASPVANRYYKLEFECTNGTTTNGVISISSVEYYIESGAPATPTCATPTFSPAAGAVPSGTTVAISCATDGATIHYTTDGSVPTATSATYEGAIVVNSAMTIKAIAVKEGNDNSAIATAEYTVITPQTDMDQIYSVASENNGAEKTIAITFGNWVVSGAKSNTAYVTDGTKGFIIYYSGQGFETGDILSGTAVYRIKLYNGAAEIVSKVSGTVNVTKGGTAPLNVLDAEGMGALTGINTGSLIKINGDCSTNNNKYYIGDFQLYNNLNGNLSFNTLTAGSNYDCTGVYLYHKTYGNEIMPSSMDDIEEVQAATLDEVTGLAALKAAERGSYYVNLTNAVVSYVNGKNAFIEDETGGALIFFQDHGFTAGDCLNGKYQVTTTDYQGKFEITAIEPQTGAAKTTAEIPLTTLTITQLNANFATYESRRVKIVGANVTDAISGSDRNGAINDGAAVAVYAAAGENKITLTADDNVDIIGYPGYHNTDQQLNVWAQSDISVNEKEDPELVYNPAVVNVLLSDLASFTPAVLAYATGFDGVAAITYESSDPSIATVETDGTVTLVATAEGSTTITATFSGNATYKADNASYTINVSAAPIAPVYTMSFDMTRASYDDAVDAQVVWNSNVVTMTADKNDGTKVTNYLAGNYTGTTLIAETRFYAKNSISFVPQEGVSITKIEWMSTAKGYATNLAAETFVNATAAVDGTDDKLVIITPSAAGEISVTLTAPARATAVTVYYEAESEKAKLDASIAIANINTAVGDDDILLSDIAATSNPNKKAISYAITSGTAVSLVGEGKDAAFHAVEAGTATITATIPNDLGNYTGATQTFDIIVSAGPATLESIAISGEATALEYTEGQDFNPAGLVVTGHYSDNTDAEISEGITWAFDPSPLTAGTTSVSVTATVSEISSTAFVVNGLTVSAAPTPTTDNVVILAVYNEKYYAMSTNNASNAFTAIAVEYDGSQVTVKSEAEKSAIQWTRKISGDNITFQTKDEDKKYMKGVSNGASMSLADDACNWSWDATNEYYHIGSRSFFYQAAGGYFKNFAISDNMGKSGYSNKAQVIVIDPANIVITSKVSAELAYDPASDEITQGDAWTAPALVNPHSVTITSYASDNEAVATVDGGVIALAGGIGTAHITAHFDGDGSYLEGDAVYTITVNAPAPVGDNYVKVTASQADWSGDYILVYEDGTDAYVWNGDYNDAASNYASATISSNTIAKPAAAAVITIAAASEGKYTLQVNGDKYFQDNGSNSKLIFTNAIADAAEVTISYETDWTKLLFSERCIRFNNTSGQTRFRFYGAENQQAVQLYKKEAPEPQYTEIRNGLELGRYYTICMEKNITAVKNATFWNLRYKNAEPATEVYLEEATTIEAGKPYIFQAGATTLDVIYGADSEDTPVENGALRGTFEDLTASQLAEKSGVIYLLIQNAIRPNENNYLNAHRAYIDYSALTVETPVPAPGRRVRAIPMQSNVVTGCEEISASETPVKMMIDGQLFIIRGEKMYDTTGRLVK